MDPKNTVTTHSIPSEGIFAKKCELPVTSPTVALLSKPSYKVRIQAGHCPNKLQPNTCLLDTGRGVNIINSRPIQGNCKQKIKNHLTPKFQTAIKEPLTFLETILLLVHIGTLRDEVWFGLVENLAVDILLGTHYIERYIRRIFPGERKGVPCHSDPIPILTKPATTKERRLSHVDPSRSKTPHDTVVLRMARQVSREPYTPNTRDGVITHHRFILPGARATRRSIHTSAHRRRHSGAKAVTGVLRPY